MRTETPAQTPKIPVRAYRTLPNSGLAEVKDGDRGLPPANIAASTLGRLGGLVKSEAKSTSSRANGRKGGRPKSTQSIDMEDI